MNRVTNSYTLSFLMVLTTLLLLSPKLVQSQPPESTIITASTASQLQPEHVLQVARIPSIGWSPDGRWFAVSDDFVLRVFGVDDLDDAEFILDGHQSRITDVAFSQDGTLLATASTDDTAIIWDLQTRTPLRVLEHYTEVWTVAFSPDSLIVATGYSRYRNTGENRLWDVITGEVIAVVSQNVNNSENDLIFSRDGILASVEHEATIVLREPPNWEIMTTLTDNQHIVSNIAFDPTGMFLASSGWDGTVRVWRIDPSCEGVELLSQDLIVDSVDFSPNGDLLIANTSTTIYIWSVDDFTLVAEFEDVSESLWEIKFSPTQTILASAHWDGQIQFWTVPN